MRTGIIPDKQFFVNTFGENTLNLKAICIFAANGFFLGKDSYFNDTEALQPARDYKINDNNFIEEEKEYWKWHYDPRDISLKQATEEFADLFEKISNENLKSKNVILPLSGGLDSRTQAVAVSKNLNVRAYSYKFENSFDETKYGREICKVNNIDFREFIIPKGYLWNVINELSLINKCYADFTHPRQMAVMEEIKDSGDIFYLGHWGDVLFDRMGVNDNISFDEQVEVLVKKVVKRGGIELAGSLWKSWELEGEFTDYLKERISGLLSEIKIDNANSRIRAFKSLYWAPRWTSANLNVFGHYKPMYLPYYDNRMCEFICTLPENLLADRQIQIEYIKMKDPKLAKIPWQTYDPYNLYNYKKFDSKSNIPNRAIKKGRRLFREKVLKKKEITRNWEIQFTGEENDIELRKYLFSNRRFKEMIPETITEDFYNKFNNEDMVYYSHPLSMLLTLSLFAKNFLKK
ncbi:MAG TPA: asparagine synthase-related protein [Ignavibacteria bacterium]|nr:asparagine synthase-related protein [Ignavibacteria bacterium]